MEENAFEPDDQIDIEEIKMKLDI
jgi:hypothetical protein